MYVRSRVVVSPSVDGSLPCTAPSPPLPSPLGADGARAFLYGVADAGEAVSVLQGSTVHNTTADAAGKWSVQLDPRGVNTKETITTSGADGVASSFKATYGEVFFCRCAIVFIGGVFCLCFVCL